MPKVALTDSGLRSLAPPTSGQIDYWDKAFKHGSFAVRISQGGTKTFLIKHANRRYTIGRYPTISLSEARTEAKRLLAEFTLGKVRPQSVTYQQAVELFLEEKRKARRARTVYDYTRLLGRFPYKGQLADLTHQELQRLLRRFTAPGEYNHLLVALRVFCNWARKRRYIQDDPTVGLAQHYSQPRSRVLSDKELQLIWRACEQNTGELSRPIGLAAKGLNIRGAEPSERVSSPLPAHFATIVKLLILTGQRKGEIANLRTDYFSNDPSRTTSNDMALRSRSVPGVHTGQPFLICTLPATATKNGREHTFPLDSYATTLLSELGVSSGLFFPSRHTSQKPFNGFSKAKAQLDKLSGVSGYVLHDLRRTYATRLSEMGVAPHIVERLLNHISGTISGVAAVYNRAQFMPEMRRAVEIWENHISALCGIAQSDTLT